MPHVTIEQTIRIALGHQQGGRLAEAEALYRSVLAQRPDHPDALHLLGVLAGQVGRIDSAIDLIGRAIAINPSVAEYHNNVGELYRRAGEFDLAVASFHRALALKSGAAMTHNNLGNALMAMGRTGEAVAAYRRALVYKADDAEIHRNLGVALHRVGRRDEAIATYRRTIELRPDDSRAHGNLGTALQEMGRTDEALAAFIRAVELENDNADLHCNLGAALRAAGRFDEAITAFGTAIQLEPAHAEAYYNLGSTLRLMGRLDEAIAGLRRAIELKPDNAKAHNNLGVALQALRRQDEAIDSYRRAIELEPTHAAAHNNLGNALWKLDQLDEARSALQRAIALRSDFAEAYDNLGNVSKDQGRLDEALGCFRKGSELNPYDARAASNVLFHLHAHPGYDAQALLAEHRRWARQFAEPLVGDIRPHSNDRAPGRVLRVGYVSPDFCAHAVGQLLLCLFSNHDRQQVQIIAYSDVQRPDGYTRQFEALADEWHVTVGMQDARLAEQIRTDQIDILVDLALHTPGNRMLVFARKPAPVQVTMFGLPATTGLNTMDYRLTDRYLDPPESSDGDYTEQSIRLPHCFWVFRPPEEAPPVSSLPAQTKGFVTFGCLNQLVKVSPPVLKVWLKILQSLPHSRLLIQSPQGSHLDAIRAIFQEEGIAGDRIESVPRAPRLAYFRRYLEIDLGLDPFPYNGHTSTLDALWMGVPVVTLAGRTAVARGGTSILSNLGLTELIAETHEQYVRIAIELAQDQARLSGLRTGLRKRLRSSRLTDGQQYAADVEAAFRWMWNTWCVR